MTASRHERPAWIARRSEALAGCGERSRLGGVRGAASWLDTQPALLAGARRLRRQMPGDERFGDPLSIADRTTVGFLARSVTGLQLTRESSLGELGLAGLQLWQAATATGDPAKDLALLFTTLPGLASWSLTAGDAAAISLLRAVGSATETAISAHQGRVVKRLADGTMAVFTDARSAIDAALSAQSKLNALTAHDYRPRLQAGVHWGRPRRLGGDYLGIDANIAARITQAAKPGQLLVSEAVLTQVLNQHELRIGQRWPLQASGAPRTLHVAAVNFDHR